MAPAVTRRRRWRLRLRNVFARGDISSLLIVWGLLIVTALAIEAAAWADELRLLVIVSVLAVGFGFLLARSHYSELLALILSSTYGLVVVLGANVFTLTEEGPIRDRVYALLDEINVWLSAAVAGGRPDNDRVVFVIFLSVLFWYLGHNAAWHVFRVDRVWRVIIPTGLVLLTNQLYYQDEAVSLDGYLIAFVVLSLLLLIRSHIEARESDWHLHRVTFPSYVRRTFFQAGGVLALIIAIIAWITPAGSDQDSRERLNDIMSGEPFVQLADLWNRLFSSLEGEGIATADYYGGEELRLTGAIQLGDQDVMIVSVPFGPRYYWRSTVYETYNFDSASWQHNRTVRAYTDESGLRLNIGTFLPGARHEVEQTFNMLIRSSRLVYAAPQPVLLGLPVEAELDCIEDFERTCVSNNRPSDVAIIQSRQTLRASDTYRVTSSISTAPATALRTAGQDYPDWVLAAYLQGVTRISPRVRDLAMQTIGQVGAQTPYDQAKAIERWLRTNIQYNESIATPPPGVDPIEWFLFDQRQGYCNYYASAMVLMLRSLGIPSRVAAGFAQGAWDAEQNAFVVRERDAHTWVEVYFPGYGWVEFEPTADEAPLEREGDQTPQAVLPTLTPVPSPTLTPTVLPPTEPSGANATPTSPAEAPVVPSTVTPTPPMPSATPPPPPDVTKVDTDGGSNVLRTALLTLAIFALAILLLVLLILFMIWYVEYRGLGGLNSIQRAYARLAIYARWIGLTFSRSATPDERRRYMIGEMPEGERPINTITRAYIRDRYAPPERSGTRANDHLLAQEAWHEARWVFIRRKLARLLGRD
ncbi:MAG: hypothetical protein JXJ20_06555 [Anaerolineae bacterium]|nr:hypothetical protein [Anaerolineae bacterium]